MPRAASTSEAWPRLTFAACLWAALAGCTRGPAPVVAAWRGLARCRLVIFVSPNAAEQFFALRPDGTEKWRYATSGGVNGSPAVAAAFQSKSGITSKAPGATSRS